MADIVVTAQKRAERLQDVPIAITAFGSADLEKQNVTSITNFTKLAVPGLVSTAFVGSPTLSLNIRGISTQDPSSATIEAPVAVYVDGVYIPRSVGLGSEILDIERVEILRGPQGTLFGRNAEGGALSIVTKQPTGEFEGSIGGTLANFGRKKVYAHINTPKLGTISTKIDGYYTKSDGFTKNGPDDQTTAAILRKSQRRNFGEENSWGVRGQVLWEPSDVFRAVVAADYSDLKQTASYFHFDSPTLLLPAAELGNYVKRTPFSYFLPYIKSKAKGVVGTLTYDVSDYVTVKSITSVRGVKEDGGVNLQSFVALPSFFPNDIPGTLLSGLYGKSLVKSKSFSQEVQLLGTAGDFNYVFGAFYFREKADDSRENLVSIRAEPGRTPYSIQPIPLGDRRFQSVRSSTFAAFAQATWTPSALDGKLKVTPGLRYTEATKSGVRTVFNSTVLADPILRQIPSVSRLDPALTVAYDFTPAVNVYVRYAQAFRDGGATVRSETFSTFGAEINKQVELGFKSELFDRRLRLNMAAYHSWVSDQQINVTPPNDPTLQDIVNVPGTTRLWGFEAEATVVPTEGLTISGNLALMDGKQPAYECGGCNRTAIVFLPKTSLGASIDYARPVMGDVEGFIHADYKRLSAYHTSPKAFPGEVWPASKVSLANARIGLNGIDLGGVRANIAAYVENIFDNDNVTFDTNNGFQSLQTPRQYGLQASIDF
ncbi:TonB-dependent receptor [uncultured Novosphingobium sp.]|uniref:TonB-dependent receptor n=1 Tax=uncultured Novosphingobium sp. TaxID=292277 RepID=UPI003747BADC